MVWPVVVGDVEQLARLRVATATGRLPHDVGAWAVEFIDLALIDGRREARDVEERNRLLRRAALLIPGSRWTRAHTLAAAIAGRATAEPGVRALVVQALQVDPGCPTSVRQILRLVA